jgi:hypothetical protein
MMKEKKELISLALSFSFILPPSAFRLPPCFSAALT